MDEKLLKHMAINSVALMLMVVVISIAISQYSQTKIYAVGNVMQGEITDNQQQEDNNQPGSTEINDKLLAIDNSVHQQLGDRYLIIKKSKNTYEDIDMEDLYMKRSICITITSLQRPVFNGSSIVRVNQGLEFIGMPIIEPEGMQPDISVTGRIEKLLINKEIDRKSTTENETLEEAGGTFGLDVITDPVKGFSIEYIGDEDSSVYTTTINIELDHSYAPILYQDEENIYIDLRRPKDVYDKIIVVDAGHGGTDCGTFSNGGLYYEKDINLSILLYLKEKLDQDDIKVYYTRTTDQTVYLNPRVNLANDLEADFFLSIHCNANESSTPNGSEVLYNELAQTAGFQSKQLAQICLEEITNITQKVNRGLVDGSEMVIVRKANMPIALIEVAFMSNQEDLDFLLKEENKKNIAGAIHNVIIRAYDELVP